MLLPHPDAAWPYEKHLVAARRRPWLLPVLTKSDSLICKPDSLVSIVLSRGFRFLFVSCGNSWSTWDRAGALGESGVLSVGKGGECDVSNQDLQGGSPRLCWLRIDGLLPTSKYWTYWSHADDMSPVNRYSCVTTWPKLFSPTPRLCEGGRMMWPKTTARLVSLLLPRLLLGAWAYFNCVGTMWKVFGIEIELLSSSLAC
jgi:hypothetical protein